VRNELLPPPLPVIELFMQRRRRRADAPPYARMAKTFALQPIGTFKIILHNN
jgi:hypothetical protein